MNFDIITNRFLVEICLYKYIEKEKCCQCHPSFTQCKLSVIQRRTRWRPDALILNVILRLNRCFETYWNRMLIDPALERSGAGLWRRLYKKLGWPNFGPLNRGSNSKIRGQKKFEIYKIWARRKVRIEKFYVWVRRKSYHYFQAKFRGKSKGDSLDALKRCLDPEMANNDLIWAKISKKN